MGSLATIRLKVGWENGSSLSVSSEPDGYGKWKFYGLQRLLNYIEPDQVHVMEAGKIIYSGGKEVAGVLETDGYEGVRRLMESKEAVTAWAQIVFE